MTSHKGTGHWDGDYGTDCTDYLPASKNDQQHVYNGPSQHHLKEHSHASDEGTFGDCSAEELSNMADEYLRLIPDGKSRPRSP